MFETFTALLLAHAVADYVAQTRWMVDHKASVAAFTLHGLVVLVTAGLALGRWDAWEIAALTAAHLAIDAVKTLGKFDRASAHLIDQSAHLVTLGVVAAYAPTLYADGLWAPHGAWIPQAFAIAAGAILTIRTGGFVVGKLMSEFASDNLPEGLENGGMMIGYLERGLIYLLVLVGQPGGVGFLIAAKSILRFDTSKDQHQGVAEYTIIGTLASFGWAILVAYGIIALRGALPPIGG